MLINRIDYIRSGTKIIIDEKTSGLLRCRTDYSEIRLKNSDFIEMEPMTSTQENEPASRPELTAIFKAMKKGLVRREGDLVPDSEPNSREEPVAIHKYLITGKQADELFKKLRQGLESDDVREKFIRVWRIIESEGKAPGLRIVFSTANAGSYVSDMSGSFPNPINLKGSKSNRGGKKKKPLGHITVARLRAGSSIGPDIPGVLAQDFVRVLENRFIPQSGVA